MMTELMPMMAELIKKETMMPKLIIESAEEKTSQKGKKYWIVSVSGKKAICFSERTPTLIGQEVEATIEESTDDMGNTRRFLKLSGEAPRKSFGKSPEETHRIMVQVAFKGCVEIGVSKGWDMDEILTATKHCTEELEKM